MVYIFAQIAAGGEDVEDNGVNNMKLDILSIHMYVVLLSTQGWKN